MVGLAVLVVTPEFTENAVALLVARATVSNEDRGAMVGLRAEGGSRVRVDQTGDRGGGNFKYVAIFKYVHLIRMYLPNVNIAGDNGG